MNTKYADHWATFVEQTTQTDKGKLVSAPVGEIIINLAKVFAWTELVIPSHSERVNGTLIHYENTSFELEMPFQEFHKVMRKYYKDVCNIVSSKRLAYTVFPCVLDFEDDDLMFEAAFRGDYVRVVEISPDKDYVVVRVGVEGSVEQMFTYNVLMPNLPNSTDVLVSQLNKLY